MEVQDDHVGLPDSDHGEGLAKVSALADDGDPRHLLEALGEPQTDPRIPVDQHDRYRSFHGSSMRGEARRHKCRMGKRT